jgi:hypothetical protein
MHEVYARVGFIYTLLGCQALEPVPNAYQYLQGTRTDTVRIYVNDKHYRSYKTDAKPNKE